MDDWFRCLSVPEFSTAAAGVEQRSLAALRDASETSYFRDDESLWVKLVVADAASASLTTGGPGGPGGGGPASGTRIDVSR